MWPSLGGIKRFSRVTQQAMLYGESYLYDLDILDRVLSGQGSWAGYRKEVIKANLNYSWIDSQLCLVKAWCTVNTSLAAVASVKKDKELFKLLNGVASIAIKNVLNEGQSIPILRNAIRQRVELAFIVRYQASKSNAAVTDIASFLDLCHLLVSADFEFLRAISASGNADVAAGGVCYRHLLRAILLSLDTFTADRSFKIAQVVHGLLDLVVIKAAAVEDVLSRADLAASFDYLLSHPRFLNASIVATSLEEHKLSIEKVSEAATVGGEEFEETNKLLVKFQELLRDTKNLLEVESVLQE
ncbi:hypothetical protein D0Z03_001660 [Geotrichum reessii]|nr:hypothetical protein D0Z03_001660 [Galactomyces reessii]